MFFSTIRALTYVRWREGQGKREEKKIIKEVDGEKGKIKKNGRLQGEDWHF
jgi:hypothetical protein